MPLAIVRGDAPDHPLFAAVADLDHAISTVEARQKEILAHPFGPNTRVMWEVMDRAASALRDARLVALDQSWKAGLLGWKVGS